MVKTGFTNAYVNTPLNKQYTYHGLKRDCPIQPNPYPNKTYGLGTGAKWVFKISAQATGYSHSMTISSSGYNLLPSSEDQFSACQWPDHKARYRYVLIKAYKWLSYMNMWFFNFSGFTCLENDLYWSVDTNYGYLDVKPNLAIQELGVYYVKIPSKLEVFGSDTGELPDGIPVWI